MNIEFGTYAFGPFDPDVKINRVVQLLAKEVESLKGANLADPDSCPEEDCPCGHPYIHQKVHALGEFLRETCPLLVDLENSSPLDCAMKAISILKVHQARVGQSGIYVEAMRDCKEKESILKLLKGERLYGVDIVPPGPSAAERAAALADAKVPTQCRRELEDLFGTNDWYSIVDMVKTITRKHHGGAS